MNIVIPMAGLGQRFADCGFLLPKPLIDVHGKPMYRYAVDCLPLHLATKLIFILRRSDYAEVLRDHIRQYYQSYPLEILILPRITSGQAETVLKAASLLDLTVPTLIHNCDTAISSNIDWEELIKQDIDGAIVTFPSTESRWSYVQVEGDRVVDMKEKQAISLHATTGTYFFKHTDVLLKTIAAVITQNLRENNEYYLSSVYRLMLETHAKIVSVPITSEEFFCFGTPQDLHYSISKMCLGEEEQV